MKKYLKQISIITLFIAAFSLQSFQFNDESDFRQSSKNELIVTENANLNLSKNPNDDNWVWMYVFVQSDAVAIKF